MQNQVISAQQVTIPSNNVAAVPSPNIQQQQQHTVMPVIENGILRKI